MFSILNSKSHISESKKEGFTIVELLLVIAIIGLLLGVSLMAARGYRDEAEDTALVTALVQARIVAGFIVNEEGSLSTLCTGSRYFNKVHPVYGSDLQTIEDEVVKLGNGTAPSCYINASNTMYCTSAILTNGVLCIDSGGYAGEDKPVCDSDGYCKAS